MEKNFQITATALHRKAAEKYIKMLNDGIAIAAPIELRRKAAKLEAVIDGTEAIGYADIDASELPNVYEVTITGLTADGKNFEAKLSSEGTAAKTAEFEEEQKAIIEKGMVSETKLEKIMALLKRSRVLPDVIRDVLERIGEAGENQTELGDCEATYEDANPSREYSILHDALIFVFTRACVIFVGPKSTGKNVLAKTVAWILCTPFYQISLNLDTTADDVYGPRSTDNSAMNRLDLELALAKVKVQMLTEAGKAAEITEELLKKAAEFELLAAQSAAIHIVQLESDILKWARYGGVLLLDEMNLAEANFLASLIHPLADGTKCLVGPGEIGTIPLHPNCVLFAGMNPATSDYTGTRQLNDATESRCGEIWFEMPESVEQILKANFDMANTTLKEKHFKACDEVYKAFKNTKENRAGMSDKALNVRGLVRSLKAVERYPQSTKLGWQIQLNVVDPVRNKSEEEHAILSSILRDKVVI